MKIENKIRVFGFFCILVSAPFFYDAIRHATNSESHHWFLEFFCTNSILSTKSDVRWLYLLILLVSGIGLLRLKVWGVFLFKIFVYLSLFLFIFGPVMNYLLFQGFGIASHFLKTSFSLAVFFAIGISILWDENSKKLFEKKRESKVSDVAGKLFGIPQTEIEEPPTKTVLQQPYSDEKSVQMKPIGGKETKGTVFGIISFVGCMLIFFVGCYYMLRIFGFDPAIDSSIEYLKGLSLWAWMFVIAFIAITVMVIAPALHELGEESAKDMEYMTYYHGHDSLDTMRTGRLKIGEKEIRFTSFDSASVYFTIPISKIIDVKAKFKDIGLLAYLVKGGGWSIFTKNKYLYITYLDEHQKEKQILFATNTKSRQNVIVRDLILAAKKLSR